MFRHTLGHALMLIGAAAALTFVGLAGWLYFTGALAVGLLVLWASWQLYRSHSVPDARKLLRASIYYLPVLLVLIAVDVTW
jgi:protoheme IX farnesyltransferase